MGGYNSLPELKMPDFGEGIQRMVALRNLMLQSQQQQQLAPIQLQTAQENLRTAQQENQQREYQFGATQALNKSYQNAIKTDQNGIPQIDVKAVSDSLSAAGYGSQIPAVMENINKFNKSYIDLATAKTDQQTKANDLMGSAAAAVKAAGYDTKLAHTLLDAFPHSPQMDEVRATIDGDPDAFKREVDSLIAQSPKQAEAAKNTAQAAEAGARARKLELETNADNPADPEFQKMKYQGIIQKIQQGGVGSVSDEDMRWARSYELGQRKTTTQSDSLGVTSTNISGPSGLAGASTMSPRKQAFMARAGGGSATPNPQGGTGNPKDALVDEIGQYKLNPQMLSRMAVKHPEIIAQVAQKYPDWSQSNYNAINKAVVDLAPSGKTGQQITSYNTFLRHAGALYDAVNTLDNSTSSDLMNKPLNWLAQHTGDPRVADFMAAMQPPMKEFQSFLLNNHAMHEEDVKDAHALIDQNKTPQEIRAVLKRFAETGSARLSEQNESFKRVTGRDIPNLVSPEAAKAYNKITGGGGGGGITVTAPNGKTYHFSDQASADKFKAAAGIQ